jgi:hypothetical protein
MRADFVDTVLRTGGVSRNAITWIGYISNEDKGLDCLSAITRDRSAAKRSYQMDAGGGIALKPPPANMHY